MDDVLRSWWATLLDDTVVRVQVGWFPGTPAVSSWRGVGMLPRQGGLRSESAVVECRGSERFLHGLKNIHLIADADLWIRTVSTNLSGPPN